MPARGKRSRPTWPSLNLTWSAQLLTLQADLQAQT